TRHAVSPLRPLSTSVSLSVSCSCADRLGGDGRRRRLRTRARRAGPAVARRAAGAPPRRARLRAAPLCRTADVSARGRDRAPRRTRDGPPGLRRVRLRRRLAAALTASGPFDALHAYWG